MKERLEEIWDGLKERLKSPFLLTFVAVWCVQHWRLVYGIFIFDYELKFAYRLAFVYSYVEVRDWYLLFWRPVFWSFISMGLYFIATFLSEGITLFYTKWVRSWLYYLIDRNKLKTQDDIDELENRRKKLQELVFDLRTKEEAASVKLRDTERQVLESNQKLIHESSETARLTKLVSEKDVENNNLINNSQQLKLKLEESELLIKQLKDNAQRLSTVKLQQDVDRFVNLFSGQWLTHFNRPVDTNGRPLSGSERIRLYKDDKGLYFKTSDDYVLRISDIKFIDEQSFSFTKTSEMASPTRTIKSILKINNASSLYGTEDDKIEITYSKVGP